MDDETMEENAAAAEAVSQTRDLAGKYLTFELDDEFYGLEILRIREIMVQMDIRSVPRTPDFVQGVISLRRKIIPVIDLRCKFGLDSFTATKETCTIVVDIDGVQMGLIVDKVAEVLDIAADDIEDTPSFGVNVNTEFILGMGKTNNKVIILLNIGKVLSTDEIPVIQDAVE